MATNYKHLGQLGLEQLLSLMATEFGKVQYSESGKGLSTNDFTNALLEKLNGIEEGANKYTHAAHNAQAMGLYQVQVDAEGHVIAVKAVEKGDITALGIPGQDTTYVVATADADGLMSKADFSKLAGIEAGANKYIHASHTAHASGFYKITVDAEGHVSAVTAVAKSDLAGLLGEASLTENGLMSAADKTKLEGIAAGAQINVIEKIMVNGEEQSISDKGIDIAVPTGALASKDEITSSDLASELLEKVNASAEGNHSHNNKALLDTYTQTEADLADAVAKKHAHTFVESELNLIQAGDVAKWNAAQANAEATAAAALKSAKEELEGKITAEASRADAAEKANKALIEANAAAITSGDATTLQSAKDYADEKIAAQIASAYKASGTIEYEQLPEPSAEVLGNVYNISNDFTTDADFVEGAGKQYKAGVNVAIVEIDGAYKYDVMAMSFTGFVQEANITEYSADEITSMWNSVFTA